MKKLILGILMGMSTTIAYSQAVNMADRDEYYFRVSFHYDGDYIDSVTVVPNIKVSNVNFSHRLYTQQPADNTIKWILEKDLNFDGIPDLMVYLGYIGYGGQGGDVYCGYIWNLEKKQFEYVETFSNLPDIELDTENETISVAYRADYSYYVKQTYKWVGKSLVLITDDSETVEDMETEE